MIAPFAIKERIVGRGLALVTFDVYFTFIGLAPFRSDDISLHRRFHFMEPFRGVLNLLMCGLVWLVLIIITAGMAIIPFALWLFFVFSGSEKRLATASERVEQTLMPSERLLLGAVQLRPFALFTRRKALGITESRIIVISRGLLGGFTMQDIQWKDLQDAEISENVLPNLCGSSLSFAFSKHDFGSRPNKQRGASAGASGMSALIVGGLPCEEARTIYSNAQGQEQAWEEKRRVRAIEETRAAAGGVYLNTGANSHGEMPVKEAQSIVEQLNGLKKLLDSGAITDVEFNEMKSKIIARA
ncbi:MAG: SHOCT domain-containing protein [Sphingomicrobium sp.]|nr:SHOCT domain-containing protein [Sphingomonadales bacterium]